MSATPLESASPLHNGLGRRLNGLPASFPEHVRELIEGEIIAGRLPEGQRVTEESLAQRLGLSRTPVREAMRMLEAQGLITTQPRTRGAYIARRLSAEEAKALYGLRVELEGFLTFLGAERICDEDVDTLERIDGQFKAALSDAAAVDLRTLRILDSDFHWTIYNASDSLLTSVVSSYWARLQRELYDLVYSVEDPGHYAAEHGLLVAALRDRDAATTQKLMREHLQSGLDAIVRGFRDAASGGAGVTTPA
ncbi:MAG TPA: GntR family transcriptional regulator [Thermoleophilaceae bacterium]|nr:GntR family transcriptional regulator [Thermoleophilaceae bacterium]